MPNFMAKRNKRPAAVIERPARVKTPRAAGFWPDVGNLAVLAGLAIALAYNSWDKWPDPIIDFGRELYLPWRITQGAVLFKDDLHLYGPLSPYLNSLFFRIGGVGLATLVVANVVIYAAILGLLYYTVRLSWGRWAAFASSAFFVGVFSFSHLVSIDNYNFLTPYSHEMTHGTLLLLALVLALRRVVLRADSIATAGAGLLAGMSLLLKPEIIFAAAAVTATAALLMVVREFRAPRWRAWVRLAGVFVAGALVPEIVSGALFWWRGGVPPVDALRFTNTAWLNVLKAAVLTKDPFQLAALGLDHPWQNLALEVLWGGGAVLLAGALAWGIGLFKRGTVLHKVVVVAAVLAAGAAATRVSWINAGYALPLILLAGLLIEMIRIRSAKLVDDRAIARLLLWTAAAAMLARMALSPRIFHYGFVQAALAGSVGVAILIAAVPVFFKLDGGAMRWHQALVTVLIAGTIGAAVSNSNFFYSYHTLQIGNGPDRFYGFDQNADASGLLVEQARAYLEKDAIDNSVHSLLVLPEGVMLNYLTRIPNSIPYFFFAPFVLADGRNEDIMHRLNAAPPDRIVVISRDMREFGVGRFGDSPEHGQMLLEFINRNYKPVYSYGYADPLDPERFGFAVFANKGHSPPFQGGVPERSNR
ncbi:MAG TPA: hypothetical protein VGK48_19190 [Terriglobia bacterium]|jgi:hypothetical protein